MYCRRAATLGIVLAAWILAVGCAPRPTNPQVVRIAILRFENLSADQASDWMGRAFSEVITAELTGVPGLYAIPLNRLRGMERVLGVRLNTAPGISTEENAALESAANQLAYGEYWTIGGKLEARLTVRDPRTLKATAVLSATAPAGDVLSVATALARKIAPKAGAYSTANAEALKDYVQGLEGGNGINQEAQANLALAADPNYGPAYRLAAELAAAQDRERAVGLLQHALERGNALAPLERARIAVEAAQLRQDAGARQAALVQATKVDGGDPVLWRALGETAYNRHDYQQAAAAFQHALAVEPADSASLNQLGYAQAYAGNLVEGVRTLRQYQALRPADVNPLDSLGDIQLIRGHLKEAEDLYVQAAKKDPNFLASADWFKAAMARLMTGDVTGADELARHYTEARTAAHDAGAPLQAAEWQWISGRRKAGYTALEGLARDSEKGPLRQLAARAYSQLAIWSLMLGDRAAAQQMGLKAAAVADALTAPEATLARFLALEPATAKEWHDRAHKLAPNPAQRTIREFTLAHALLLAKQFGPAQEVLRGMYDSGNPSTDESLPVLLAWSLLENGRDKEAAPLLEVNPVPATTGAGPFLSFYFPRLFFLRGELAEKQGKSDEAKANYQLFKKLSGDEAFQWGEEQKAK